jgi:PiT family inorganic phosphate transporter
MSTGLIAAIALAFAFAATNGLHDASNAIAAPVATRAMHPLQAALLAAVFNLLGPLLLGAAVANTVAGIVTVAPADATLVIGAALAAAVAWNLLTWWLGLPSSSGHALLGGLVGAALVDGGLHAVRWGGLEGGHPVGVLGTLLALAVAPAAGVVVALLTIRIARTATRRATRRWRGPVRAGQWVMSAGLAFSHGANDAQKAIGLVAALLLASGHVDELTAPLWVVAGCSLALTLGTTLGGWRIVKTVGRRIYRIKQLDGLTTQSASAGVIFSASLIGAPVSTTQVVASSVVGVGGGRRRWRHVDWAIVRLIGLAWVVTIPATALLAAAVLTAFRTVS